MALESRKEINPQNCAGCWFVCKEHPPAHIEIRAGGYNAVDRPTDKQDVDFFPGLLALNIRAKAVKQDFGLT